MRARIIELPSAFLTALLVGLLLVVSVREGSAETWKLYLNARFGTVKQMGSVETNDKRCAAKRGSFQKTPTRSYHGFLDRISSAARRIAFRIRG